MPSENNINNFELISFQRSSITKNGNYKEYNPYLEWRYGKKIKKKSCKRNRLQDLLCRSPSRTRTYDSAVNSRVLYRLSYRGILADTQLPVKPIRNKLYLQNFIQKSSNKLFGQALDRLVTVSSTRYRASTSALSTL